MHRTLTAAALLALVACSGSTGPRGPEGPPGPEGLQGARGDQGIQGPRGEQGAQGVEGPAGPKGDRGDRGDQGPVGEAGPQGPKGILWRGAWDPGIDYATDDAVEHAGSAWVAISASTGAAPPGPDWQLLAAKGETGPEGPPGATGPEGPAGAEGPIGPRGEQGPPGTFTGTFTGDAQVEGSLTVTGTLTAPNAALVPAGSVLTFAGATCPNGWLAANGAELQRDDFPELFDAIQTRYGGSTSTTFRLPDLRGEFVRGWDGGRGVDPARALGSAQAQDFKSLSLWNQGPAGSYSHGPVYLAKSGRQGNLFGGYWATPAASLSAEWDGSEVRPRNVALLYCIKY